MTNPLTKIFGANFKTSVTGIGSALFGFLTILAALPYQLGDVATIIPPNYKAKIFLWSAIATAVLRILNSLQQKDKTVTGGTIQQTSDGSVAGPGLAVSTAVVETIKADPKT